jgi:ribosome assembly protein YihI (activator of Der GTPase)
MFSQIKNEIARAIEKFEEDKNLTELYERLDNIRTTDTPWGNHVDEDVFEICRWARSQVNT